MTREELEIRTMEETAQKLKAKVRRAQPLASSSDDDDNSGLGEDDTATQEALMKAWGNKKGNYYGADDDEESYSDSRGDRVSAKKDEEFAALAQQRALASSLSARDYGLDSDSSSSSDGDDDDTTKRSSKAKKKKNKKGGKKKKNATLMMDAVKMPTLTKDLDSVPLEQKIQMLERDAPELIQLLHEFKDKVEVIKNQLLPLLDSIDAGQLLTKDGLSYLQVKFHLLLSYCTDIVFYLLLKVSGKPVKGHPVIDELLRLRVILTKLGPVDKKLSYQVSKLLRLAHSGASTSGGSTEKAVARDDMVSDPLMFKPSLGSLRGHTRNDVRKARAGNTKARARGGSGSDSGYESECESDEAESEYEDEDELAEEMAAFVAPKVTAVNLGGAHDESSLDKKARKLQRKLKNSAMLRKLKDEFADRPEEVVNPGVVDLEFLDKATAERIKYEEENFTRLVMTKKQKNEQMRKQTLAQLNRLDEFDDFRDLATMKALTKTKEESSARKASKARSLSQYVSELESKSSGRSSKRRIAPDVDVPIRKSLNERANDLEKVRSIRAAKAEAAASKKRARGADDFSDDDTSSSTKRQKALDPYAAALAATKDAASGGKKKNKKKKPKIRARPAPEGYFGDDNGTEGGEEGPSRRGAGKRIVDNRGLVPKRKKEHRNPRKKGRLRYEKAVSRRRGQVGGVRSRDERYGGEQRGINADVAKGVKFD